MLDLVNDNYQDFLSLGNDLQGGDEKAEEVRLGLLGFRREIEGLKGKVDERRREVEALVNRRKEIRRQMQLGRALLDVDYRLCELERSLMVVSNEVAQDNPAEYSDDEVSDSGNESNNSQDGNASTSRLDRHVKQYLLTERMVERIGSDHPLIVNQKARMARVKSTILLDLGNGLKQTSGGDIDQTTKLLAAYRDLGEPNEALKVLKEVKARRN